MLSRSPLGARARERRSAVDDLELELAEGEAPVGVAEQRPGQQMRLAQHLKAVADPEHQAAVVRERDHRLHRRREARDRARAQVVAVGEAARDDDRVGALQVALAVPDQLGVAHAPGGVQRIDLVAGAGELEDAELHFASAAAVEQLDLVVLDERVGEQLLAHRLELGGVLDVELDQPADVHVGDAARSPARAARARRRRPADRGCPPSGGSARAPSRRAASARSSHAWKGSPVISSYAST